MPLVGARRGLLVPAKRSLYADLTTAPALPPWLLFARATATTDSVYTDAPGSSYNTFAANVPRLGSYGLGIFEQRTQYLLNSTAPATQTVSLATGSYTLWAIGTGTVAVSAGTGAATGLGTHTPGTPLTFNVTTAGTFTFTVSGTINRFQCENGTFPTPFIVSGNAAVTRSADIAQFAGAGLAFWQGASWSGIIESASVSVSGNLTNRLIGFGGYTPMAVNNGPSLALSYNGGPNLNASPGTGSYVGTLRTGASSNTGGRSLVVGGGSVGIDSGVFASPASAYLGSQTGSANFIDGYIHKLAIYNYRLPPAVLQAKTVAGASLP